MVGIGSKIEDGGNIIAIVGDASIAVYFRTIYCIIAKLHLRKVNRLLYQVLNHQIRLSNIHTCGLRINNHKPVFQNIRFQRTTQTIVAGKPSLYQSHTVVKELVGICRVLISTSNGCSVFGRGGITVDGQHLTISAGNLDMKGFLHLAVHQVGIRKAVRLLASGIDRCMVILSATQ